MPKVGIVISNYNGWQDTLVCLESLQKMTFRDFEIVLIDDASPNDSVAQLQGKLPPNTVFLPQEKNVGFAAANNIGMRRALADGCDYALLLNNDTSVHPDFLEKLLAETPEKPAKDPLTVNYAEEAAKELGERLGRGCRIVTGRKKGRIELEYYGTDDLNDLLDALHAIRKK